MALSGLQVTQFGVSGYSQGQYGAFTKGVFVPTGQITIMGVSGYTQRPYSSFLGKAAVSLAVGSISEVLYSSLAGPIAKPIIESDY